MDRVLREVFISCGFRPGQRLHRYQEDEVETSVRADVKELHEDAAQLCSRSSDGAGAEFPCPLEVLQAYVAAVLLLVMDPPVAVQHVEQAQHRTAARSLT